MVVLKQELDSYLVHGIQRVLPLLTIAIILLHQLPALNSGVLGGSTNLTDNVLSQTIATVNGGSYQLQFKYGYAGTSGQKLNVTMTNVSPALNTNLSLPAVGSASTYTGTFQATSSSVTLTFTDNVAGNSSFSDADIAIDDVSLTGPSPAISAPIFNFNKPAEIFASEVEQAK